MPALQGLPGMSDTFKQFISLVREYMRDYPELNRLTAGQESSDRQIAWAILNALSDFNGTPPFIGNFSVENMIQYNQQYLLLQMTVVRVIESVGLLQTRNHINYNNGGITVGINDKTPLLLQWIQMFKATTEQMKQRVKTSINISNLFDVPGVGTHSELWAVNSCWAAY